MKKVSKFDVVCATLFSIGGLAGMMGWVLCGEPLFAVVGVLWFILSKLYIGIPVIHIKE